MFSRALQACRRPRPRFAVIIAIAVACFVANEQARAEPAAAPVIASSF
jgi:hypothetical protein